MNTSSKRQPQARDDDRIDISHDYAVCAWARYFNTSEQRVREAVRQVGDRVGLVREHLVGRPRAGLSERPSGA